MAKLWRMRLSATHQTTFFETSPPPARSGINGDGRTTYVGLSPSVCENAVFTAICGLRFPAICGASDEGSVEEVGRGQSTRFPASPDDSVTADNPVRAVDVFVND
jgi:hypothetical protein